MSDTDKLIAEARDKYDAFPSRARVHPRPIELRLADALEAALEASRTPATPSEEQRAAFRKMDALAATGEDTAAYRSAFAEFQATHGITTAADSGAEEFRFTDQQWRDYQNMPDQGYSHRHHLEYIFNSWLAARAPLTPAEGEAETLERKALERILHPHQSNGMDGDLHLCSCGRLYGQWWKHLAEITVAAGFACRSPVETEENWEYGRSVVDATGATVWFAALKSRATHKRTPARKVPAGPWLPVTEEKKP